MAWGCSGQRASSYGPCCVIRIYPSTAPIARKQLPSSRLLMGMLKKGYPSCLLNSSESQQRASFNLKLNASIAVIWLRWKIW